jgi:hypothetical protein
MRKRGQRVRQGAEGAAFSLFGLTRAREEVEVAAPVAPSAPASRSVGSLVDRACGPPPSRSPVLVNGEGPAPTAGEGKQ